MGINYFGGGGGDFVRISDTGLIGAVSQVDITVPGGYTKLFILGEAVCPSSKDILMRFNDDAGGAAYGYEIFSAVGAVLAGSAVGTTDFYTVGSMSSQRSFFYLEIHQDSARTKQKMVSSKVGNNAQMKETTGIWTNATDAITKISLICIGDVFTNSQFVLYGCP